MIDKNTRQVNILFTSAGRRTYIIHYFQQALQGRGKVFASNSIYTYTLGQADGHTLTPEIYNPDYIPFLLQYCKANSITAIIPLFDIDLPILAKHRTLFEQEGITLVVSDYPVAQTCNDKWATYQLLKQAGLNQPPTFLSLAEATQAIDSGAIEFPLIVKPRWGMGSIGIYTTRNREELNVLYAKLRNDIWDTALRFESAADKEASIIIQQQIKGQEYGIEILNDLQGHYAATFAKKKIAMRSGETDVAETVDPTPFLPIAQTLSSQLRHRAMLDVDCFVSPSGDITVLEMNCRFGGQYPFTHNAGVNVPLQLVRWLQGLPTDPTLLTQRCGVRSCKDINPVIF